MNTNRLVFGAAVFCTVVYCASSRAADSAGNSTTSLDTVTAQAAVSSERAVRDEMHLALMRLAESGALGATPEQLNLDVQEPAQRSNNLGLIIESSSTDGDGVRVIGVTPGGTAARMGVLAGDLVISVNSHSLSNLGEDTNHHALAPAQLKDTVNQLADGEALRLDVLRGGKLIALNAPLHALNLPAMRLQLGASALFAATASATDAIGSCGRISAFDVAPRQQQLHRAILISIDGKSPGPQGTKAFVVPVGTHVLEVDEAIESRYISFSDIARTMGRHSKKFSVDVSANNTYMIASHLIPENRNDPRTYWEPVMWKQIPENCP